MCCTKILRSLSEKWLRYLKNSHAKVKFFVILKFFTSLNRILVSGLTKPSVECFSRNSFQSSNVSSRDVMILALFLISTIPLTELPSLSGLILCKRLAISVLNVCNTKIDLVIARQGNEECYPRVEDNNTL